MAFTAIRNPSETQAYGVKALAFLLMLALMLSMAPVWASSEPTPTMVSSAAAAGEASSTQPESAGKKNDLAGFFTIGAIINVLFLGAFLLWARKESQKGKKKKTGAKQ